MHASFNVRFITLSSNLMPHSHQLNMLIKLGFQKKWKTVTETDQNIVFYTEFKWILTLYIIALNLQSINAHAVSSFS